MKISFPSFNGTVSSVEEAVRHVLKALTSLQPSDNFRQLVFTGTTPGTANTAFTIAHNLNRIFAGKGPNGDEQGLEFVWWLDGGGTLYEINTGSWTDNEIQLACTEASRAYTIIVR